MVYTGTLWMGSGAYKQDVNVVFDTGSDWLIVETTNCRTCKANRFEIEDSTSFQPYRSGTVTEISYGTLQTKGFEAIDYVCITDDDSHCV